MTARHQLSLALAALFLVPAARDANAQDVVVDQWLESFTAGHKVSYSHRKISKTAKGYVYEWLKVDDLGVKETKRVETDARGIVLRSTSTVHLPFGKLVDTITRDGEGYRYEVSAPNQETHTGELSGDVTSGTIHATLVATGAISPGEHRLGSFNPMDGRLKRATYTYSREGDVTVRAAKSGARNRYDAQGQMISFANELDETLPTTKQQATDMSRTRPARSSEGMSWERVTKGGVEVRRPTGKGWDLQRDDDGVGLQHPLGIMVFVGEFPVPVPSERAAREHTAKRAKPLLEGSKMFESMGEPTFDDAWGRPSITFPVLMGKTVKLAGTATLSDIGGKSVMVLVLGLAGNEARVKDELAAARAAIRLPAGTKRTWQRQRSDAGVTLEVPSDWKRFEAGFKGAAGLDELRLSRFRPRPDLATPVAVVNALSADIRGKLIDAKLVTPAGETTIGGRQGAWIVIEGEFPNPKGPNMRARITYAVAPHGTEGQLLMVIGIAFEMTSDYAVIERAIRSLRFE